jgi:hypothetical protein
MAQTIPNRARPTDVSADSRSDENQDRDQEQQRH